MNPFFALGGVLTVSAFSWAWAQPWIARRRHEQYLAGLLLEPLETLAERIKNTLRSPGWGWESFSAAQRILAGNAWTEQMLLDGLKELQQEVAASDQAAGRSGRDCDRFHYYDCGLMGFYEALIQRLAHGDGTKKTQKR
ncbi:MAG: hypothetical protein AB8H86_04140 [Polyangiales bacterium]